MKKVLFMFCMVFAISSLFSACSNKAAKPEQASIATPSPTEQAQTYAPQESGVAPTDNVPEAVAKAETPEPMSEETMQPVRLLVDYLKEDRFDDIQPLLTDGYDFDNDALFNRENYSKYIDLSEFSIVGGYVFDGIGDVAVEVSRPDANQILSDFYDMADDISEDISYDGDMDDYVKSALEAEYYPTMTDTISLTLTNTDGEWKIVFNSGLLELISATHPNPFAPDYSFGILKSRVESTAYINSHVTLSEENGVVAVLNNGGKSITSMSLKLEYTDKNGVVKRTAYWPAFSSVNYGLNGTYEMYPGYMWAESKDNLFYDSVEYGASLDKCEVFVFDVQYKDDIAFPTLSTGKQSFCDEFVAIDTYKLDKASTVYCMNVNGITKLKISNKSDKTIRLLSILAEFLDKDGVVRSGKAFIVVGPDETSAIDKIDPNGTWTLDSGSFFPLFHVPDFLVKQGNIKLSVIELEYE